MDLKEYIKIFQKNFNLFIGIVLGVIIIAFSYFYFRPVAYNTSLMLNITRAGAQDTPDYKYDDFYRIQADDKFAETLTEWLQNPRVVSDIYSEAGLDSNNLSLRQLSKSIKPEKLSSQLIVVNFSSSQERDAKEIARSIFKIISQNTDSLNRDQKENTWFKIIAQDPVIRKNTFDSMIVFLASLVLGVFLGFWGVMVRHYLK